MSGLASQVKKEKRVLNAALTKIVNYGVPIWLPLQPVVLRVHCIRFLWRKTCSMCRVDAILPTWFREKEKRISCDPCRFLMSQKQHLWNLSNRWHFAMVFFCWLIVMFTAVISCRMPGNRKSGMKFLVEIMRDADLAFYNFHSFSCHFFYHSCLRRLNFSPHFDILTCMTESCHIFTNPWWIRSNLTIIMTTN